MEMPIIVRPFESGDRDAVRQVFADTAYFGDSLEIYFDDREMLCDYYTTYYTDYEPQSCFVAKGLRKNNIDHLPEAILEQALERRVKHSQSITQAMSDAVIAQKRPGPLGSPIFETLRRCYSVIRRRTALVVPCTDLKSGTPNSQGYSFATPKADNEIIGYLMGCLNTERQKRVLRSKIVPAVLKGLLTGKYQAGRKTWLFLLKYFWSALRGEFTHVDEKRYPAHLHINITARSRGMGVGKSLMNSYFVWLRENNVPGVHLETTTHNVIAVDFFKQFGFQLLEAKTITFWRGFKGEVKLLLLGKRLQRP